MINISRSNPTIVLEKCDLWKEVGRSSEINREVKVVLERQDVSLSNETIKLTSHQVGSSNGFNKPRSGLPSAGALNKGIEKQSRVACEREWPDFIKSPKVVLKKCNKAGNRFLSEKTKKNLRKERKIFRIKKLMNLIEKGPKIVLKKCDEVKNVKISKTNQPSTIPNDTSSYPATVIEKEAIGKQPEITPEVIVIDEENLETGFTRNNINKETGGVLNENTTLQSNCTNNSSFPVGTNIVEVKEQVKVTSKKYSKTYISRNVRSWAETESIITQDKNNSITTVYYDIPDVPVVEIDLEETEEHSEVNLEKNPQRNPENLVKICNVQVGDTHKCNENADLTPNCDHVLSYPVVVKIENDSENESGEFYSIFTNPSLQRIDSRVELLSQKARGQETLCANRVIKLENKTKAQNDVTRELVGFYSEDSLPQNDASYRSYDIQSLAKTVKCENTNDYSENSGKKLYTCNSCSSDFGLKINLTRHLLKCLPSTNQTVKVQSSSILKEIPKSYGEQKLYTCTRCSENFNLKMNFIQHMRRHTTSKLLSCSLCPVEFYAENNLQAHMKKHCSDIDSDMFKKLSDEKKFPRRRNKIQKGEKPLAHTDRRVTLKRKSQNASSRLPLRKTTNITEFKAAKLLKMKTLLACACCSASFKSKQALKFHTKTHTTEHLFSCKDCPAKFIQRASLLSHLKTHQNDKRYSCKQCPAKLRQKSELRNHSILHTRERPFCCRCCPARFIQKANLQLHLKIHTSDKKKLLSCTYCGGKFATVRSLRLHSRIHSNKKCFSCMYCYKGFLSKISLQTHLNKFHPNNHLSSSITQKSGEFHSSDVSKKTTKLQISKKPRTQKNFSATSKQKYQQQNLKMMKGKRHFSCPCCSINFYQEAGLKLHMRKHAGSNKPEKKKQLKIKKAFTCAYCSVSFKYKGAFLKHILTHTGKTLFCCLHCSAKFTRKVNLQKHSKKHNSRSLILCVHCSMKFRSVQALSAHSIVHSDKKPYPCAYCSAGFVSKMKLRTHLKKHTNNKLSSRIQTSIKFCGSNTRKLQNSKKPPKRVNPTITSKRKSQIKNNAKMSAEEQQFSCTHCSAIFRLKASLKVHMKKHANIKKLSKVKLRETKKIFNCSYCSANFNSLPTLENHTKTHTGKNIFSCKYCPAVFKRNATLQKHLNVHSKRPFSCECCPAVFKRKDTLQKHLSVHSNRKPFSCEHCSATFKRKDGLQRHLGTHSK